MQREKLAQLLNDMALFLELQGDNPFKIRAHQNAARIIETFQGDLEASIADGSISEVKGIGPALKEKITEFYESGKISEHDKLKSKIPAGLLEILQIPSLGPKKARALYEKLKIKNVAELEYACKENRLLKLDGFGEKSQEKILKGIEFIKKHQNQFLYSDAILEAGLILSELKTAKGIDQIELAGSLRRKKEIIKDIDILVSTEKPEAIAKKFLSIKSIATVTAQGETKISVVLKNGIACDLRIVKPEEFAFALLYFTGSKEHNVVMRGLAKDKGYKLNEYGLFKEGQKTEKSVKCKTEEDIFNFFDLVYIQPELRENTGEIEAAKNKKLPVLIEEKNIKGVFHCHTTESDGINTLEEMVAGAQKLGYEYIGISDHSVSSEVYANGLKKERVIEQWKKIETVQKKFKIKIFRGIEADILVDGDLDYDNKFLAQFDFVIGSLHSALAQPSDKIMKRVLKAFKNPFMDIFGHPTARLLLGREPSALNMNQVIDEATKQKVIVELNANPQRLDLDWRFGKYLKEKKGRVSINPDAHSVAGLEDVEFGIGIARKGWLSVNEVINTLPANKVLQSMRSYGSRHG